MKNLEFTRAMAPLMQQFKSWEEVPQFAIITGQNGAGKSQLLEHINTCTAKHGENSEVFYLSSTASLGNDYSSSRYDTSYPIVHEYDKHLEKIKKYFAEGLEGDPSDFSGKVIEKLKKQLAERRLAEVADEHIKSEMDKTIEYEKNEIRLNAAIGVLKSVCKQFEDRKKAIEGRVKEYLDINGLYEAYSKELSLEEFARKISNDKVFRDEIIEGYAKDRAGDNPIDEVNIILKKYGFKYELQFHNNKRNEYELIVVKGGSISFDSRGLSTGEIMFLTMMTWQYYYSEIEGDNKVKLMLLDEPDKHLDPKLCKLFYKVIYEEFVLKQGIQVIMSSHRIDTVALAPPYSIFVIEESMNALPFEVVQRHKLQSMFQMTSNLKELIGYHHRVYTESLDDMLFYEGVYNSLRVSCATVRDSQAENSDYYWYLDESTTPRLLSERYQLSFHTSSTKKGDEGGSVIVLQTVQRDLNTHGHSVHKHMFEEPELHRSFGVLDNDYGTDWKLLDRGVLDYVTVLGERHSLENFIFDPFVFCSTLTEEEIHDFIMASNVINHKLDKQLKSKDTSLSPVTPRDDIEEANNLIVVCLDIKQLLSTRVFNELQLHIESYFCVILKVMNKYHQYVPEKKQKLEEKGIYKAIEGKITGKTDVCDTNVKVIVRDESSEVRDTILVIQYPQEFLKVRGHDIAEFFIGKKNQWVVTEAIASRVQQEGLGYIPLDLANIFFNLNQQVRNNVRQVIKQGKVDPGPKTTYLALTADDTVAVAINEI
ncbi:MAG: AAA family ATPase, partial [Rickettsiales bacterium]|nr:AAA family ATPase [Rickettsiales bacterium]